MLCAIITRYERKDTNRMPIGDEQDTIEIMATVKAECPPHDLHFVAHLCDSDGNLCTVKCCRKCKHEEWVKMPDEREKRRE